MEGDQGWVTQGVLSRASFRRSAVSGQRYFTVLSLHISNIYAKKKGIAKKIIQTLRAVMISQEVDLKLQVISLARRGVVAAETIAVPLRKPLLIVPCLRHWAPHHYGDLDPSRTTGLTYVDFSNPPALSASGRSTSMVPFSIPWQALGLRPNDQSCHHETWLHLHFVDWNNKGNHQAYHNRNIRLKERPASSGNGAQKRHISDVMSDHSLSS